jgi:hypothetical protein
MDRRVARILTLAAALLIPTAIAAQQKAPAPAAKPVDPWAKLLLPNTHTPTPTTAAITAADLRTRLFIFAADSMQGRVTGSAENAKGV